ncbi:restriction endonuclease [Streptacidiphilus jiangxiensis]|uniref:Restriction system protein n=1 Tax=Streptacidiphilus jiangxiensis TaxID=235985 RepID=A0A1H7RZM5_STRJI|nr:restriction endonuclease [Streptacidiphilus jiangxiensis]SEL64817.1 restriction system protein [Streptacidiphilus jiangxiensis]
MTGRRRAVLAQQYTEVAEAAEQRLDELLDLAAEPSPAVDFDALRREYTPRPLPSAAVSEPPRWADYEPDMAGLPVGHSGQPLLDASYQQRLASARLTHQRALREYRDQERTLRDRAEEVRLAYEREERDRADAVRSYNERLVEYRHAYEDGEPAAVESVLERALAAAGRLPGLEVPARVGYRPLTRTAVIDLVLPGVGVVPPALAFRVSPDESEGGVEPIPRPRAQCVERYLLLVARVALRALDAVVAADTESHLDGVVLNGRIVTAEAGETTLLSVDARRGDLYARTLLPAAHADAVARLRELPCRISDDPYGPGPVAPYGVSSPTAPLPEELSPGEFSGLAAELFAAMGLPDWDARLVGRDGLLAIAHGDGATFVEQAHVVCVARRPAVVGAEAVRNVAEVMDEEAAHAGIWATTGSFHPQAVLAAADCAGLRLIDGGELRALIREHLGAELGG